MGLLDRLLGRDRRPQRSSPEPAVARPPSGQVPPGPGTPDDERAIERYRYLLRTAPPHQVEEAHAEAFARLAPEQRRQVLDRLATTGERPPGDDPRSLARAATRAEMRQPGTLERTLGGRGFGSMVGASMLGTIGGLVVGTAVADALFDGGEHGVAPADGGDGFGPEDAGFGADGDYSAGFGGGDFGGGDF